VFEADNYGLLEGWIEALGAFIERPRTIRSRSDTPSSGHGTFSSANTIPTPPGSPNSRGSENEKTTGEIIPEGNEKSFHSGFPIHRIRYIFSDKIFLFFFRIPE
jgi:hypothetical protein